MQRVGLSWPKFTSQNTNTKKQPIVSKNLYSSIPLIFLFIRLKETFLIWLSIAIKLRIWFSMLDHFFRKQAFFFQNFKPHFSLLRGVLRKATWPATETRCGQIQSDNLILTLKNKIFNFRGMRKRRLRSEVWTIYSRPSLIFAKRPDFPETSRIERCGELSQHVNSSERKLRKNISPRYSNNYNIFWNLKFSGNLV